MSSLGFQSCVLQKRSKLTDANENIWISDWVPTSNELPRYDEPGQQCQTITPNHQLESRHQILCWKCLAGLVWVQLSSLQVSQLTSVSDHDYKSQEQALSKGTSSRKGKATSATITYRSLVVFSGAERPFVWAKSCSDDAAVGAAVCKEVSVTSRVKWWSLKAMNVGLVYISG